MPDNDIGLIMCPMWDASSPQLGIPLLKAHLNSVGYSAFAFDLAIRLFNASSGVSRQALQDGDGSLLTKPAFIHQLYDEHAEVVDRCLEELLDSGAKAFGFSLYCSNLPAALTFAQRLKLRDPSRRIIVGGPECARLKEGYFRPFGMERWFDIADAVVPGEGEMALADLLERVRAGTLSGRAWRIRQTGWEVHLGWAGTRSAGSGFVAFCRFFRLSAGGLYASGAIGHVYVAGVHP